MKYINQFEEFLTESKHVNNCVIKYTGDIILIIDEHLIKNNKVKKINITTDINNRNGLKLSNLNIKVDINPDAFSNYGSFKKNFQSKIVDDNLDSCSLYLQLNLTEGEINDNKISLSNIVRSLINHELNHAFEVYQYELNNRKYRSSWEVAKMQKSHMKFADNYKYWKDFIHLIYLGLEHEMGSRISSLYEDIKTYTYPQTDIKSNKIYKDALFMSKFNFEKFYNLLIGEYGESLFLEICGEFCNEFNYKFKNDIQYCKGIVNRIIKSLNKKGVKILNKIQNLIKRVEIEKRNPSFFNEGHIDRDIDYGIYE